METINHQFYKNAYKEHGVSAKGVHWHSKKNQYYRFEILTSFLKNIKNSSIIDIGCGFGEYLNYLKEKDLNPDIYLGIDCEEFMINISKKRFPSNVFLKCDILKHKLPKADYLICSGTLNILKEKVFLESINKCFHASNRGFVFNFLTNNSIHNLSLDLIKEHCLKLTKKVTISSDYIANDCTIFLEK